MCAYLPAGIGGVLIFSCDIGAAISNREMDGRTDGSESSRTACLLWR